MHLSVASDFIYLSFTYSQHKMLLTKIYLFICLFIYFFIYVFIYLFIYLEQIQHIVRTYFLYVNIIYIHI